MLADLEPVDQTTSFEHEPTTRLPMLKADPPPSVPGKRRAVKHAGRRGPLFKGVPSAPVLVGIAALAVSVSGAVITTDTGLVSNDGVTLAPASALSGSVGSARSASAARRSAATAAGTRRQDAAGQDLAEAAEGVAEQRNAALQQLATDAESRAKVIAKNLWRYPRLLGLDHRRVR